jgi:acetyl/propionyl-CoA carboxylase alpha subunit
MPEMEIITEIEIIDEVAARVCASRSNRRSVDEGAVVVIIEAMKMEILAAAPATGTVKPILVRIDDMVGEGQVRAILQT